MSFHHHLKMWLQKKLWSKHAEHEEETVAVPEVHTGKVHHDTEDGTPAADKPIHYDNVAIPEVHIHPRRKR